MTPAHRTRPTTPITLTGSEHGTDAGYSAGCGCDLCHAARMEGNRRRKKANALLSGLDEIAATTSNDVAVVTVTQPMPEQTWGLVDW